MGLKDKYAYRKLHKKASNIKRIVKLPHPDEIRKIGILWTPLQKEAYLFLADYFSHKQTIFRTLCVDINSPDASQVSNVITSKDLNWLGFPKAGISDEFINMDFDLLMNIALKQNKVLDYITALSRAKFKTGWSPYEKNFFDLNIKIDDKQDALYLAKQQIFYLSQLNIKN